MHPRVVVRLAFILAAFPSVYAGVPEALVVEGIPPGPEALASAVAPYLEYRPSIFQDWHPRRRDVLITTRHGNTPQLHRVALPGKAPEVLTSSPDRVAWGAFQPNDGSRVVFLKDAGGSEFYQLHRLDPGAGEPVLLTDGKSRNTGPCWAPRGGRLAYASTRRNGRDTDLYVMDPARPETDRRVVELSGGGWSVLDWSPDERQLLVQSVVSINESYLHLVDVAKGDRRLLTPALDRKVAFSDARFLPDGSGILAVTDLAGEYRQLMRRDLANEEWLPVAGGLAGDVDAFDVSPDGRRVVFSRNEDGISRWMVADLRRNRLRTIPGIPAGVVEGLRFHSNGRDVAFTLSSARSPGDVYSVDLRTAALTRWTEGQGAGAPVSRFAEPELVRVASFDGLGLSGFLYRPDPGRFPGPRPVVVSIHGGPESQSRPGFQGRWNYLLQEMGVAILYPNVRGSAGYGKTFLTLDNGRKREDSVRDIGAFLDWIGRDPGLDAARVGVYGGSYGGFMVLASMAEFGERIRCGIDVVGISSFLTFLENTQDYRRDLRRVEYGDERDPGMAEYLRAISPLTRVDRIRQPLFVVQGRNDPRVPVTEAEQMVRAIRAQGGVVWYLMARDEGHGFVKKPNVDFMFLSIVQFLQAHLLGPGVRP